MIGHLDDESIKEIVAEHFGPGALPCCSPTHGLAIVAHRIIRLEIKQAWPTVTDKTGQGWEKVVDKVWNSQRPSHVKAVQSALWRAFWCARDAGYIAVK